MNPLTHDLPDDVFNAITAIIPRLMYIAEEECDVNPIELLVLWHIRHFGKVNSEQQSTILRHDLTEVLTGSFRYSDADVSRLIEALHDKGLILRTSLTTRQRAELFGEASGPKLIVVLKPEGDAKLEEFKGRLRERYNSWIKHQPGPVRLATNSFLPVVARFTQWLVERHPLDTT